MVLFRFLKWQSGFVPRWPVLRDDYLSECAPNLDAYARVYRHEWGRARPSFAFMGLPAVD